MTPITDQDLMLHYYGESDRADEIERALESSPELRDRYDELNAVLDAAATVEAPEPELEYGARLWRRLEPRLGTARASGSSWLPSIFDHRWAVAAAALVILTLGVLVGRYSQPAVESTPATSVSQRILMDTVAGHLGRTEILLLELANTSGNGQIDLTVERELAAELNRANRLYRQAARNQGHLRTVALLDDLELLLIEVAHASDLISPDELDDIRRRLDDGNLLFKVQVVGARLRRMPETTTRSVATDRSRKDA